MAQKELETQVKLWWCDAGCTAGVQLFVLLDGSRKNQIRHINHSFFLLDPRKNPITCINRSFYWMRPEKITSIMCINHSFFWMDPGKNPIKCKCKKKT